MSVYLQDSVDSFRTAGSSPGLRAAVWKRVTLQQTWEDHVERLHTHTHLYTDTYIHTHIHIYIHIYTLVVGIGDFLKSRLISL